MNHGNNTYPADDPGVNRWNTPVPGPVPPGGVAEVVPVPPAAAPYAYASAPLYGQGQSNAADPANRQVPAAPAYAPAQVPAQPYYPGPYPALQPNPYYAASPAAAYPAAYVQPVGAYYPHMAPQFTPEGFRKNTRTRAAASELNKTAAIGVAMFAAALFFQVIMMLVLTALGIPIYSANDAAFYWLNAVLVPLATLLPGVVYLRIRKPSLQSMVRFENKGVLNGILAIFAGLSLCLLLNYPAGLISRFFESTGYNPGTYDPAAFYPESTWIYLLAIVILAPVMEEFVFRGIIFASLEKFGAGFAIVASALVFGMAHLAPSSFIFATGAGLVFGYVYYKTRNLWVAVAIHFLNNLLAMAQEYYETIFGKGSELLAEILLFFVPIILGLLCLIFLILFRRKSFFASQKGEGDFGSIQTDDSVAALRPGESAKAIFTAPCVWIMVGYMIINLVLSYFIY